MRRKPKFTIEEHVRYENYRSILSFIFAVDDINKNPELLPNITLGYHIVDTCGSALKTSHAVFNILSGRYNKAPNYRDVNHGEVAAFVVDSNTDTMVPVLDLYKHTQAELGLSPQEAAPCPSVPAHKWLHSCGRAGKEDTRGPQSCRLNYGVGDYILNNRDLYPTSFKLSPDDRSRYISIVTFLEYIGWNWVGLITSNDENNEVEARELSKVMAEHKICVMYVINVGNGVKAIKQMSEITKSTVEVLVVCGPFSLYKYVKHIHYIDPDGRDVHFNDRGNILHYWYIANLITYADSQSFRIRPGFTFKILPEGKLNVHDIDPITWKNQQKPQSRCNDRCSPGYRKAPNGGYHVCCYDCVLCSEGEFSNITDSESCHKCPEEEWPDEKKEKCVPKTYEFLSYESDILVYIFLVLTSFFSAITLFTLGSFIYYWDTPIVKANNRTVSFILLVSILLSFLCVFFFLGRPVDITCMMRQVSFGIFFSIGVSSVLAKTITVCIAFKATKPGSVWLKWVSPKVSNSVVWICSSVQVLICVIWLLVSPPYVEFDHHTYPGEIAIQCNEGSDIWFYSMLGYLGFLAAVSFVLAFMVRTLPDTFNEAKYITFSMLMFCSVWIAMIPAYLSTRGKYMVAVEVFAILASCAGILGCIFFPKVFILLLKPNLNSRNSIIEKNNYNLKLQNVA
ncbi:vomeronasal type-2 receptor 26-like [Dendropsophus ebraccatus]|uniref:vomeronasal type-2 receptor 26-like n=1 Tax=Dendropsophus ebraccatus TaxID=150705 RepID=UPI00383111DF